MQGAPSKRDAYGVGGVLTPNRFDLFTAKAVPTRSGVRGIVGVKFISREVFRPPDFSQTRKQK